MKVTRRQVLAATAVMTGATVLGVGVTGARWWNRSPGDGLLVLSMDEYDFVQAVAEAWMPAGGDPPLSGADARLGMFMDESLSHSDAQITKLFKLLLQSLDDAAFFSHGSSFRDVPMPERSVLLHHWMHHPNYLFRSGVHGVMALMSLGWTLHPDVTERIRPMFKCGFGP